MEPDSKSQFKSQAAVFLGTQVVMAATLLIFIALSGPSRRLGPVGLGAAVSLLNSIGLLYAWPRILAKKDVALAFSVIVSKFALSVGVVYWLTRPSTHAWFISAPAAMDPSGVAVPGSQVVPFSIDGVFESPLVFFALGLAVVLPAAVIAAWFETRMNGKS